VTAVTQRAGSRAGGLGVTLACAGRADVTSTGPTSRRPRRCDVHPRRAGRRHDDPRDKPAARLDVTFTLAGPANVTTTAATTRPSTSMPRAPAQGGQTSRRRCRSAALADADPANRPSGTPPSRGPRPRRMARPTRSGRLAPSDATRPALHRRALRILCHTLTSRMRGDRRRGRRVPNQRRGRAP
jgi:hypothetical protein